MPSSCWPNRGLKRRFDGIGADDPANLTYQPKLSPKWISPDGKEMILIWSDAMKNEKGHSHTTNYKWNQMKITLEVGD